MPDRSTDPARTDWHQQELLLIREVGRLLGRSVEPHFVIRQTLRLLSEWVGLNRGRVLLWDAGEEALRIRHWYGLTADEAARGTFARGEGVCGGVFRTGMPRVVQDIDAEPDFLCRSVERARLPKETVSFIAVPLREGDRVCGVLAAHRLRHRRRAIDDDLELLQTIGTLLGQVIRVNEELRRRTERLESREPRPARAARAPAAQLRDPRRLAGAARVRSRRRVGSPPATRPCCCSANRAPARSCSRVRSTRRATARPAVREGQLRGGAGVAVRVGVLRPRARRVHRRGHRAAGPLRAGRRRHAVPRRGRRAAAAMQAKLLRVLQDRVVVRVGSRRELRSTCASSPRPTATSPRRSPAASSASTCTTGCRCCRSGCRRCASARRTCRCWCATTRTRPASRGARPGAVQRPGDAAAAGPSVAGQRAPAAERRDAAGGDEPGRARRRGERRRAARRRARRVGRCPAPEAESRVVPAAAGADRGRAGDGAGPELVRPYAPVTAVDAERVRDALARAGGNRSRAAQMLGMTRRQFTYRLEKLARAGNA
jgi:Nif-specific regulatory protein